MRVSTLKSTAAPVAIALGLLSQPALGQEPIEAAETTADAAQQPGDVIYVTGSRIGRPETDTATPVVAVTAENIEQSGLTNITELLTETPALFNSEDNYDASGSQARDGGAGVNLLDLRNLGPQRTLVLIDGRRHIPGITGESGVDIATIPVALIERVDVLTGGVSSVYGADGVSGVVNFIMKHDFEGIDIRAQQGISDFGDADSTFVAGTIGKNIGGGRGNIALSYEYRNDARVEYPQRPNGRDNAYILDRNPDDIPDDPDVYDYIPLNYVGWADSSPNGAVVVETGASFELPVAFQGNGQPYDSGKFLPESGFHAQGGDNTPVPSYYGDLQAATRHHTVNLNFDYDLTDAIRVFAEGKYVSSHNFTVAQPSFDFYNFVEADNPFIPATIKAAIKPGNFAAFGLPDGVLYSRDNFDFGTRDEILDRDLYRGVFGFDGDLTDNARFEVSYVYGRNNTHYIADDNRIEDRFFAALDAVDEGEFLTGTPNGNIVCRVDVDGTGIVSFGNYGLPAQTFTPGDGSCKPLNVFGEGVASQESLDFILADLQNEYSLEQHVLNGYLSGDFGQFFELPGGPVGFAIGGEYRKETSAFHPDDLAKQTVVGDPESGVLADLALLEDEIGKFDVKEAFAELNFPILSDRPFFELLEFNAAIRLSDYSTTGSSTSWSLSGQWAPVRDVRFRGSYSHSVRAPNITEIFAPRTGAFDFLSDPCSPVNVNQGTEFRAANCRALIEGLGVDYDSFDFDNSPDSSASIEGLVTGNQDLTEEEARTWTAGVILQPSFIPNLVLSFDWYDIYLSSAINTADLEQTAEFCVDAPDLNNAFCNNITRDPDTGYVVNYILRPENVAFFETAGADMTVNYRTGLGKMGDLNLRGTLGYLDKLQFLPANGGTVDDDRGEAGAPKWVANADVTWRLENFEFNYGVQYIGDQLRFEHDEIAADPDIAAPEYITIDSRFMHDIRVQWTPDEGWLSIYAGVNNITNELPALGLLNTPTGWLGRYMYAGMRIRTAGLPF